MVTYERVSLNTTPRKTFILRVTSESDTFLRGIEVDREGEDVAGRGFDTRRHIIQKTEIVRRTELDFNLKYGTLERVR